MTRTLAVAAAVLTATTTFAAGYCDNTERGVRWRQLSERHPHDYEIQTLDALRIGLCQKVESGALSEREMVQIFWSARTQLVAAGVGEHLEDFLNFEADRRRREKTIEIRVERLREEYEAQVEAIAEIDLERKALRRKIRRERDWYQDNCKGEARAAAARCDRSRQKVEADRKELEELREERTSAERRQRTALQRLNQAKE